MSYRAGGAEIFENYRDAIDMFVGVSFDDLASRI